MFFWLYLLAMVSISIYFVIIAQSELTFPTCWVEWCDVHVYVFRVTFQQPRSTTKILQVYRKAVRACWCSPLQVWWNHLRTHYTCQTVAWWWLRSVASWFWRDLVFWGMGQPSMALGLGSLWSRFSNQREKLISYMRWAWRAMLRLQVPEFHYDEIVQFLRCSCRGCCCYCFEKL